MKSLLVSIMREVDKLAMRLGLEAKVVPGRTTRFGPPNKLEYDPYILYRASVALVGKYDSRITMWSILHEYGHKKQYEVCPLLWREFSEVCKKLEDDGIDAEHAMSYLGLPLDSQMEHSGFLRKVLPKDLYSVYESVQRIMADYFHRTIRRILMLVEPRTYEDRLLLVNNVCGIAHQAFLWKEEELHEVESVLQLFHPYLLPFYEDWKELIEDVSREENPCNLLSVFDGAYRIFKKHNIVEFVLVGFC